MERIQAAIQKAKEQRAGGEPVLGRALPGAALPGSDRESDRGSDPAAVWEGLAAFSPDPEHLRAERLVSFERSDPAHLVFDMMRTKILRQMRENNWTSLVITSPTSNCGKTMVGLNLAFSLAHQKDSRTIMVDLDLRRPAVARTLGLRAVHSMENFLGGAAGGLAENLAENFVRYGSNLAIGADARPARNPAELLHHPGTGQALASLRAALRPDVVLYDLPPMLVCDDVSAFLPHVDCALLVVAAEVSTLDEVDKCERDLAEQTNLLGVVLNKCRYVNEKYDYYY